MKNVEAGPPPDPASDKPLERRQLTIMFTDLVNSTGLADSMDPEDFRVLIEAHRTIAVAPIMRYGGVVARYLGDGMLVYFGYPEAHEDDPDRAVRAGLEVVAATKAMNQRWVGEGHGRIAVRIGIHTGIVVVGDVVKADVHEAMAVFGDVPSLAARLQGLAEPDSVVLSGQTRDLLRPTIRCQPRGRTTLKGITRPVAIFTALDVAGGPPGERTARATGTVLPFVNRQKELATVRKCWASAKSGQGRAILLAGDPGIGKSRLIRAIEERIVSKPCRWLTARTSPYATNSDFFAFSELFHHLLGRRTSVDRTLEGFSLLRQILAEQNLTDSNITLGFAGLLGIDISEDQKPASLQPERARELTLTAITTWFTQQAKKQPIILAIEDLHWADASSLEAIDRLETILPTHPILLIKSTRGAAGTALTQEAVEPGETPDDAHPAALGASQASAAGTEEIFLDRLAPDAAQDLLDHVIRGAGLPETTVSTLLERANGVPLFLEELPKPVLEADALHDLGSDRQPIILPATLRDSLMAQLDRMGSAKTVAQVGAVLGHSFDAALLRRVWNGDPQSLNDGLTTLTDAALLSRHGTAPEITYAFRHALLAEIAYDSLLRQDRRNIHRQTADTLVAHFHPLPETRPELIARHYAAADDASVAFDYWLKAGRAAARRSANTEAIGHLRSAEAELERLGKDGVLDLDDRWLALYMARGPVLSALLGWSAQEVEKTFTSALTLFEMKGKEDREAFSAWRGYMNVHALRGDVACFRRALTRMFGIANKLNDQTLLCSCHSIDGFAEFLVGNFESATKKITLAIETATEIPRTLGDVTDPSVIIYSHKAWSDWFLGNFQAAETASAKALEVANDAQHPQSLCYALCLASSLAQCQEKPDKAYAFSDAALALSIENSLPYWQAWASVVKGWALAMSNRYDDGLSLLLDGIARYEATHAAQMRSYNLCLLAKTYQSVDKWSEAALHAEKAAFEAKRTGIVFYLPEALRLLGENRLKLDGETNSNMKTLLSGVRLAERQGSLPLHLKACETFLRTTKRSRLRILIHKRATRIRTCIDQAAMPLN